MKEELLKNLTNDQMEQLKGLTCEQVENHFKNSLYGAARFIWKQAQADQIIKGAHKYPEPFNPASWDNNELFEHAVQENVDQMHYLVGMKQRLDEQQMKIDAIRDVLNNAGYYNKLALEDRISDILEGIE